MSNPYDKILRSAAPQKPEPREREPKPPASSSGVLSKVVKKKPVLKPAVRFCVRPRYRFDLPEPPMDLKMLLGPLSTSSYAEPYISSLEKDFRAPAIPGDPTYGLHGNLVESSMYDAPANLNVDDDALLMSVMNNRPGYTPDKSTEGRRGPQKGPNTSRHSTPSAAVPWMRRMSYDEYVGGSSNMTRQKLSAKKEEEAAKKLAHDRKNDPKMRERRRRQMLQSFDLARKNPVHPDRRKLNLRPVHVAPILPDFFLMGEEFVAVEFDKDDVLTHPDRTQKDAEGAEESVRSLVTLPVENEKTKKEGKKHVAVYTPSNETLRKRKRLREDNDGANTTESERKKLHFAEEESYDWIGEYSVREGKMGGGGGTGGLSRSAFALKEYVSEDTQSRVVFLSRIGTSWKLSKRPGTMEKLGLPGLDLHREEGLEKSNSAKRDIVSGESR